MSEKLSEVAQINTMDLGDQLRANKFGETANTRPNEQDYIMSPAPSWRESLFTLVALSMFAYAVIDEMAIRPLREKFSGFRKGL